MQYNTLCRSVKYLDIFHQAISKKGVKSSRVTHYSMVEGAVPKKDSFQDFQ